MTDSQPYLCLSCGKQAEGASDVCPECGAASMYRTEVIKSFDLTWVRSRTRVCVCRRSLTRLDVLQLRWGSQAIVEIEMCEVCRESLGKALLGIDDKCIDDERPDLSTLHAGQKYDCYLAGAGFIASATLVGVGHYEIYFNEAPWRSEWTNLIRVTPLGFEIWEEGALKRIYIRRYE